MRAALDARPRPLREFRAGDRVACWRRGRGKGRQKDGKKNARWHGRATVLGEENGHYWLSHAGTLIRAAPEHLRHATREEEWADWHVRQEFKAAQE
eukprot:6429889-Pyramimonas_sp.AAC.1